jgi:hypothetical protein
MIAWFIVGGTTSVIRDWLNVPHSLNYNLLKSNVNCSGMFSVPGDCRSTAEHSVQP